MLAATLPRARRAPQLPLGRHAPFCARVVRMRRAAFRRSTRRRNRRRRPSCSRRRDARAADANAASPAYPVGYNTWLFQIARHEARTERSESASASALSARLRRVTAPRAARSATSPARASVASNARGTAVVVAGFLRRREMQHGRREAREPFQAAAHVEIADQRRRRPRRAIRRGARHGWSARRHARAARSKRHAAHADIAASDDQHARPAEVSCRFHGGRIVAVKRGRYARG